MQVIFFYTFFIFRKKTYQETAFFKNHVMQSISKNISGNGKKNAKLFSACPFLGVKKGEKKGRAENNFPYQETGFKN
jgi:hypothetical protein